LLKFKPIKNITIPSYSLQELSQMGNAMFEIIELTGQASNKRSMFLTPHRKDFYTMIFVKKGGTNHWVDFTKYTIKPDTFYFSVPHQVMLKEKSEPIQGIVSTFTEEFLQLEENKLLSELPVIKNPENKHELILAPDDVIFINDIMQKMIYEFKSQFDWQNSMLQSYLRVLLIYVSRLYTEQFQTSNGASSEKQLLRRFRDILEKEFYSVHQAADYADKLHITAGHLSDIIKRQSGKTVTEHIHERIALEAKRHLLHTDDSVKQIAYRLGFEDAAYFNRFFKRLTNTTPASYRVDIRKKYH